MRTTPAAAAACLLLLAVACGTGPDPASAPEVSAPEVSAPEVSAPEVSAPEVSAPEVSAQPAPALPASPTPTPAAPAEWVMPDLTGVPLQDAQDAVQALTGYGIAITTSTDATGAGRLQVSDRNWRVCAQNVPPGTTITAGTAIDFAVVKLEESC